MAGIQNIRDGFTGVTTKIVVVLVVLSFTLFIGWPSFFSSDVNVVATIDGKKLSTSDLLFEMQNQQYFFEQKFPDQNFELDKEILQEISTQSLIRRHSLLNFIEDSGIEIPDQIAYDQLSKNTNFFPDGIFSLSQFEAISRSLGFIPGEYLKRIKEDIALSYWSQGVGTSSFVTESAINELLTLAEQTRDISFVKISFNDYLKEVSVSDEVAKDYYNNNTELFQSPEQAKIIYINISQSNLKTELVIAEDSVKQEYSSYLEDFDAQTRRRASHIMLNINNERDESSAVQSLNDLKKRFENGESFEDLVVEYSEDEGTKSSSGDLGVSDGSSFPPEFEKALLVLKEDELSNPIVLEGTAHLLLLTDFQNPKPEDYENIKSELLLTLERNLSEDGFFELLDRAADLSFSLTSLKEIADELGLKLKETEYFSENQMPETLSDQKISKLIFESTELKDGEISEVIEITEGEAFIIQLADFKPQELISFEKVLEETVNAVKKDLVSKKIKGIRDEITKQLQNEMDFYTASQQQSLDIETYKGLSRTSALLPRNVLNGIFSLPRNEEAKPYNSSLFDNGDLIFFRLDSVNDNKKISSQEEVDSFSLFMDQERQISELSELKLKLQDSADVSIRMN